MFRTIFSPACLTIPRLALRAAPPESVARTVAACSFASRIEAQLGLWSAASHAAHRGGAVNTQAPEAHDLSRKRVLGSTCGR